MCRRILIVEDEPLIAEDLASILRKDGHVVVGIAHDGSRALDLLHSQSPDLVLLDISLGNAMSGFDVARVLNDRFHIPFIFITSYADKDTLAEAKKVNPKGYIVKPFRSKDVCANVALVTDRSVETTQNSVFKSQRQINEKLPQPLSEKEYEIVMDIARGKTNQEISDIHAISLNTVKTHVRRIFSKLDASSRTQVVAKLLKGSK